MVGHEVTVVSFIWQFQNLAKVLEIEFSGWSRNRGLDDRVVAVNNSRVGMKKFDSFGKDMFLNIRNSSISYARRSRTKHW